MNGQLVAVLLSDVFPSLSPWTTWCVRSCQCFFRDLMPWAGPTKHLERHLQLMGWRFTFYHVIHDHKNILKHIKAHVCQTSKSREVPLVGLISGPKCYLHFMIFPKGFSMGFSWKCRGISVCLHRNLYFFTRKHYCNCMQLQLQFAKVFSAHLKNGPSLLTALGKTSLPDGFMLDISKSFGNLVG